MAENNNEERLRVVFSAVDDGLSKQMDALVKQARELEQVFDKLSGAHGRSMGEMAANADKTAIAIRRGNEQIEQANRETRESYKNLSRTQAREMQNMNKHGTRTATQSAKRMQQTGTNMMKVGGVMTAGLTVPLAAFGKQAVDSSRSYDSGMKDVQKVTDATDSEMAKLGEQVDILSKRWGINSSETLATVEAYAQMGVANEDLAQATEVSTQMQKATNLTAEESALIFGRLSSVMGTSVGDYDRLGSSIVALGNTTGATESEIAHLMERMSGTANVVGVTEAELAGLSASMAEAGITAERGGTSMNKTMQQINTAVSEGGAELEGFASVAGTTAQEFASQWADDPMTAIVDFVGGLKELDEQGVDTTAVLKELGITNQGQISVIQALMGNYDGLTQNLETANKGWEENVALSEEANTAMEKQESAVAVLAETWDQLKRRFGDIIENALQPLISALTSVIEWLSGLSDETLTFIAVLGAVVAAAGPVIAILGALQYVKGTLSMVAIQLNMSMAPLIGTALAIAAAFVGLIAAGIWLVNNWEEIKARAVEIWTSIKEFFSETWQSIVTTAKEWWNGLKEWLSELWATISETISQVWTGIKEFFAVTIPEIVQTVIEWFSQLPEWFSTTWNNIIDGVTNWVSNMISKAIEVGSQFVQNVITFINELPYKLGHALGTAIGTVISWGVQMGLKAYETGSNFVTNLIDWFQQLPGRIQSWLSNTISKVTSWASNMASKARDAGSKFLENVSTFISQLPGKIANWLSDVINRVTTWATNMASKAREAGSRFLENVSTFVSQLPGKMANWLNQVISRLSSWVSEMASKGREAGSRLVSAVTNAVQSLPGKMVSFGKDVVRGFWNGITSLGGWLKGKVSSFFSGIIDGAKSALKISSPSRVFRDEVGKMVALGFGVGIERNEKEATRPMANMIDSIVAIGKGTLIDPLVGINGSLARTNASINSRVDHNFGEMSVRAQPAYINVNIGGQNFRGFVENISDEQGRMTDLELQF